jgi:hypothetical protein
MGTQTDASFRDLLREYRLAAVLTQEMLAEALRETPQRP